MDKDNSTMTEEQPVGFMTELKSVLKSNRKLWMTPAILAGVVVLLAVFFGSTGEGSFIYSLF